MRGERVVDMCMVTRGELMESRRDGHSEGKGREGTRREFMGWDKKYGKGKEREGK